MFFTPNKIEDSNPITLVILLPPSYAESRRSYPVVYFLPGYSENASEIVQFQAGPLATAFSAVFAASPGLFDQNGLKNAMETWYGAFLSAYGAAFSPNLALPPPSAEIPKFDGSAADQSIVANWESGFGDVPKKIADYQTRSAKLSMIHLEYGTYDTCGSIPEGCDYTTKLLTEAARGGGRNYTASFANDLVAFTHLHRLLGGGALTLVDRLVSRGYLGFRRIAVRIGLPRPSMVELRMVRAERVGHADYADIRGLRIGQDKSEMISSLPMPLWAATAFMIALSVPRRRLL